MKRYLSKSELDHIFRGIPDSKPVLLVRNKLAKLKVDDEKLDVLEKRIRDKYYRSQMESGSSVGVKAALCIGEPTTQLVLNSVLGETQLLVSTNGVPRVVTIGEFVDSYMDSEVGEVTHIPENRTEYKPIPDGVQVPTVDKDGNVFWSDITAVTRHDPGGRLCSIETRSGRKVTATESKSFLVWRDSEFVEVDGSDLKVGDYMPTTMTLPELEVKCTHLDLSKYLPKTGKHVSNISESIELDEEFGFIVGIYLADGCATNTFVSISNKDTIIQHKILSWCKKYSITISMVHKEHDRFNGYGVDIKMYSVIIARLFKSWLKTGASNKEIPQEAFNAPDSFVKGLLDGYCSGDGTVTKRDKSIVMSSASEQLILGVQSLASRFGVFGRLSSVQPKGNNNIKRSYSFSIRNKWVIRWRETIGLTHPKKAKRLRDATFNSYGRVYTPLNDVVLDPIKTIEFSDPHDGVKVYDLTVPSTKNFTLFNGLGQVDTFHSSGFGSNKLQGVPRLKELLHASRDPKKPTMTIYFESKPQTIYELPYKYELVETQLGDLVRHSELIDKSDDTWYTLYERLFRDIPADAKCIRLHLDRTRMYRSRVTVMDIHRLLNCTSHSYTRSGGIDDEGVRSKEKMEIRIWSVPGPMTTDDAIIDLYTRMDVHLSTEELNKRRREITNIIFDIHVKGIKGIQAVFFVCDRITNEWSIQTDGSNLADIFGLEGVDPVRTTTDNLREIESVFGIEAARRFLQSELKELISNGAYVHPAHFKILVDSMTYMGQLTAVARFQLSTDEHGAISLATFEQPIVHFTNAAEHNLTDKLDGVSGSVITAKIAPTGTGVTDVHLEPSIYGDEEQVKKMFEHKEITIHERIPDLKFLSLI